MNVSSVGNTNQEQSLGISNQTMDSITKSLQKQINDAQQQLRSLSENNTMSSEEKMKKRQEIQKQINDLNNQLRQHQMELKKEEREKKQEENKINKQNSSDVPNKNGMSQSNMESLITADSAMNQAKESGKVVTKLKGKEGVLESEIKLDESRGVNVDAKLAELAKTQQGVYNAQSNQFSSLKDAKDKLEDAEESDNTDIVEKTDVKSYSKDGEPIKEESEPSVSVLV